MHFEAFEQTLRLRLVSGPVDKFVFFISRNSLFRTVGTTAVLVVVESTGWQIDPKFKFSTCPKYYLNLVTS